MNSTPNSQLDSYANSQALVSWRARKQVERWKLALRQWIRNFWVGSWELAQRSGLGVDGWELGVGPASTDSALRPWELGADLVRADWAVRRWELGSCPAPVDWDWRRWELGISPASVGSELRRWELGIGPGEAGWELTDVHAA
jgi:hypothetical protein